VGYESPGVTPFLVAERSSVHALTWRDLNQLTFRAASMAPSGGDDGRHDPEVAVPRWNRVIGTVGTQEPTLLQ
jgi:hypothetical protein